MSDPIRVGPCQTCGDYYCSCNRMEPRSDDLFITGSFQLHSGSSSDLLINCNALSDSSLAALAARAAKVLLPFGSVEGVPQGGLRFAEALRNYAVAGEPILIVDDVLTTGASMEQQRAGRPAYGVVIFARWPCPAWVWPLFTLWQPPCPWIQRVQGQHAGIDAAGYTSSVADAE